MIHNFPELVVILDIYYRKILDIRTAITYAKWRSDFKKVYELKKRELRIRKKIGNYINFYKTKMANNYLQNRIYGHQLTELELYFEKLFEGYHCGWYHSK